MAAKKLSQREIEANWQAMKDFLKTCVIDVDNGNTMLFNAHGAYINKSKGTTDDIPSSMMSYAANKYGSMSSRYMLWMRQDVSRRLVPTLAGSVLKMVCW